MAWTTGQLAELVDGELVGAGDVAISAIDSVDRAGDRDLTFVGDEHYAQRWAASKAAAALVRRGLEIGGNGRKPVILVDHVDAALVKVLEAMAPPTPMPEPGVHPTAVVDDSATLGEGARIGARCYVGAGAVIGDRSVLQPGATVADHARIGCDCTIWYGVVIRDRCVIGDRCIIHPNVSIGADGFGHRAAPGGKGLLRIPQIGIVEIGHDVEIGAGTCIDRGTFGSTRIGDGTKIDNLCQIGHNCQIGRCVIMAGSGGLAGSVTVGDGVLLGGSVGVKDHVTIGDGAQVAAYAAVKDDIPAGARWAGYPAQDVREAVREHGVLKKIVKQSRTLQRMVDAFEEWQKHNA